LSKENGSLLLIKNPIKSPLEYGLATGLLVILILWSYSHCVCVCACLGTQCDVEHTAD